MDGGDGDGDTRTFRVNFSGEGFVRLRGAVKDKLKEYLGDYTDDTLAEYVIVLLRNGRQKEEARKELSVFLEKDSVPFVSWLWDHLASNLHLYLPPEENLIPDENEKPGKSNQNTENVNSSLRSDSETEPKRSERESRNRRNREWRGVGQDETDSSNQIALAENVFIGKHSPIRRSRSPRHEKRRRYDEPQTLKDMNTKPVLGAPSRLLQFAVRDAVKTTKQSTSRSEQIHASRPSTKRLRSVVSTSTVNFSQDEAPQKTSRNVFSRLGFAADSVGPSPEDCDDRRRNGHDVESRLETMEIDETSKPVAGSDLLEEKYRNVNGSFDRDEFSGDVHEKDQHLPAAASLSKIKISSTSARTSTRKPPQNRLQKEPTADSLNRQEKMEMGQQNLPTKVKDLTSADGQKGVQKSATATTGSSCSTTRLSEDSDSRTIFVSNVHFAATKDALSRHFNKFGEVLKVVIITDAATGQPTGSAYVEFLRNESAELALSLNGTSFMSRILKVVLRSSSAHHDAATSAMNPSWTRGHIRAGRYSFPRASIAGAFRARLSVKPGARSLQWKRDSPSPVAAAATAVGRSLLSPTGRSLTYVRSKPDAAPA